MYKVIYIDKYNTIKIVEQETLPDPDTVACFSGEETDPVPHVYIDADSETAIQTRRWAVKNAAQQQLFKIYYQQN